MSFYTNDPADFRSDKETVSSETRKPEGFSSDNIPKVPKRDTGSVQQIPTDLNQLGRIFNTAVVGTQAEAKRDYFRELSEIMEQPAFRAILNATHIFAHSEGLSEKEAAETIIQAFRRIDQVWQNYVFQEGVERIRNNAD